MRAARVYTMVASVRAMPSVLHAQHLQRAREQQAAALPGTMRVAADRASDSSALAAADAAAAAVAAATDARARLAQRAGAGSGYGGTSASRR